MGFIFGHPYRFICTKIHLCSTKQWIIIILKITKEQVFTPSGKYFFGKATGEMKLIPSLFRVKIFKFLPWLSEFFGHVRKELDKKAKGNFKTDNIIYCKTNNLNAHIAQYLKKWRQSDHEVWSGLWAKCSGEACPRPFCKM